MKNIILEGVTGLAAIVGMLSMSAVDSEYRGYALVAIPVCLLWLCLFYYANRHRNWEGR